MGFAISQTVANVIIGVCFVLLGVSVHRSRERPIGAKLMLLGGAALLTIGSYQLLFTGEWQYISGPWSWLILTTTGLIAVGTIGQLLQ
ncbi:hypothetical protein ACOJIV_09315 [Haloarcula sp. AONF1]|uniref:hypothetical protein n=1 Tax=Haloarcula sp. CBA1127 TaxID=1765055 RepID=UPI00073E9A01|nr:hypothetical protein [Haloarcula sp. CBA1127]